MTTKTPIPPDVQQIVFMVCQELGISPERVFSKTRKREISVARQISIHIIRENTFYSLKSIGRFFERDHTTIIHAIDTVADMSFTDKKYKAKLDSIIQVCNAARNQKDKPNTSHWQVENLETFNELKNQL